ncbi:hypothetical protein OG978_33860 [Streptomyces sp. NBC_01591]|uniref:hypothetical protein n=1 Tax=Streptomyces sp. NBC_01591 TaxID=2975888 RepID=UPI002DD8CEC7|nr:hypothetical protein [Streptomyces sp. NBC_01591]WSD71949.1 hypothetical protein OG978_33860 [Streptomyces sp. NBC_01591]
MAAVGSVDVELELIGWLQSRLGTDVVVRDELDNHLLEELPTVQVEVVGGDDDGFRLDRALVDISTYAATRATAIALAITVHGLILEHLRGSSTTAAVFGAVRALTRPAVRPYENTALRRVGATYQIHSHPVT